APDEINAWAGQSAAQYMVEACYACRYALDLQTHIASVLIYINTSCLAGFRGRSPRVRQARPGYALNHRPHDTGGHRQSDTDVAAARGNDGTVHPDRLAAHVDQRPARIAGIYRGVGLQVSRS